MICASVCLLLSLSASPQGFKTPITDIDGRVKNQRIIRRFMRFRGAGQGISWSLFERMISDEIKAIFDGEGVKAL
jgi:hypothetical protein